MKYRKSHGRPRGFVGPAFPQGLPVGKRRFSLRTLLIVTTLVAVALGLFMWGIKLFPSAH